MPHLDIIADILSRVASKTSAITEHDLTEIEQDVRDDWGGERPYIAKIGECGRIALEQRNAEIYRLSQRGVTEDYLSLRYGIGLTRIRQIVLAGKRIASIDAPRSAENALP